MASAETSRTPAFTAWREAHPEAPITSYLTASLGNPSSATCLDTMAAAHPSLLTLSQRLYQPSGLFDTTILSVLFSSPAYGGDAVIGSVSEACWTAARQLGFLGSVASPRTVQSLLPSASPDVSGACFRHEGFATQPVGGAVQVEAVLDAPASGVVDLFVNDAKVTAALSGVLRVCGTSLDVEQKRQFLPLIGVRRFWGLATVSCAGKPCFSTCFHSCRSEPCSRVGGEARPPLGDRRLRLHAPASR